MMDVRYGAMPNDCFINYMKYLTDRVYKILPMSEENVGTIVEYMNDLCEEMIGNYELIESLKEDGLFLSLMGNIQYLIKDENYMVHKICKKKVFNSISTIEKLINKYSKEE